MRTTALFLAGVLALAATSHAAVSYFLDVPGITGAQTAGGLTGVMQVGPADFISRQITVTKLVDKATPQLFQALVQGKSYGPAQLMMFNAGTGSPPDATIGLGTVLVSSQQSLGGTPAQEQVVLATQRPAWMYLDVPGIPGAENVPGYPGVMLISDFTFSGNEITVTKRQDAASPKILQALVQGTHLGDAKLLLYDTTGIPTGAPDQVVGLQNLLVSGQVSTGGIGGIPEELDTFAFTSVAPEPAPAALLSAAAMLLTTGLRTRRTRAENDNRK